MLLVAEPILLHFADFSEHKAKFWDAEIWLFAYLV
jgi:hypothetical protein